MTETSERNQSLWWLTAAPSIWAANFLLSYAVSSIWCTKFVGLGGSLWPARVVIVASSMLALAGIGITGWIGYRKHAYGDGALPHDADTPEDRHRFLGFATMLLASLSAVATVYVAIVPFFFRICR